jgi:membrane-associated protein
MLHRIADFLLSIPAGLAIPAVFLLSAGETAAVIGMVIPGQLTVALGGALAAAARLPLAGVLAAGILGPIAGDTIGYFLGRRAGRPSSSPSARRVWERARTWVLRHDTAAIFAGRFTPYLRSVVPRAAGFAGVPFPRFFGPCAAAGLLWGAGSVLLGYFVGARYERLTRILSEAHLGVVALAVVAAGAWLAHRLLARRP